MTTPPNTVTESSGRIETCRNCQGRGYVRVFDNIRDAAQCTTTMPDPLRVIQMLITELVMLQPYLDEPFKSRVSPTIQAGKEALAALKGTP